MLSVYNYYRNNHTMETIYSNKSYKVLTCYNTDIRENFTVVKLPNKVYSSSRMVFKLDILGNWFFLSPISSTNPLTKIVKNYLPNGWSIHKCESEWVLYNVFIDKFWNLIPGIVYSVKDFAVFKHNEICFSSTPSSIQVLNPIFFKKLKKSIDKLYKKSI